MLRNKSVTLIAAIVFSAFLLGGCDDDSELEEGIEEAGEQISEATTDAGNAIEDACENVKEQTDAEDTDC